MCLRQAQKSGHDKNTMTKICIWNNMTTKYYDQDMYMEQYDQVICA